MADAIASLLARNDVRRGTPATEAEISAVIERFGEGVPRDLRRIWREAGALEFPTVNAAIIAPPEILRHRHRYGDADPGENWLPLLDTFQSNDLVLVTRGPVAPELSSIPMIEMAHKFYFEISTRGFPTCQTCSNRSKTSQTQTRISPNMSATIHRLGRELPRTGPAGAHYSGYLTPNLNGTLRPSFSTPTTLTDGNNFWRRKK